MPCDQGHLLMGVGRMICHGCQKWRGVFNLQFRVTSESLVSAYKWEVEGVFNLQFRVTSESLVSAYKSASFFSKLLNLYLFQYMLVNKYSQCKGPRDKRHDL